MELEGQKGGDLKGNLSGQLFLDLLLRPLFLGWTFRVGGVLVIEVLWPSDTVLLDMDFKLGCQN